MADDGPSDRHDEQIATELEAALDARRQRILISRAQVNFVKWSCLFAQAACTLLAIALVHSDNRLAATITMGVFATGVAASMLLILSHDRPFIGQLSIGPDPLLQVMPEAAAPPVVAAPAAPSVPEAPAAAPPPINPLEKPASKPVAHAGGVASAVFPSEISPAYAGEQPSVARLKTCSEQYHANAAANFNGGLKWNSYRKECIEALERLISRAWYDHETPIIRPTVIGLSHGVASGSSVLALRNRPMTDEPFSPPPTCSRHSATANLHAAVMPLVRRQRRPPSASCAGLQSRQFPAHASNAGAQSKTGRWQA
jgi:hypothetical protein